MKHPIKPWARSTSRPVEIASFDVFDTLLTRAVGSPEDVFLLLGRSLAAQALIPCGAEAFACARIAAEQRAFQNTGASCTIERIYRELSSALSLPESQARIIMEQECALETRLMRAVPGAAERIRAARLSARKVVFLSDMYLPADWVRQRLHDFNLAETGDGCYVSCEQGKDKPSGGLFRDLLAREGVQPGSVVHQGNNARADIQAARKSGMRADPYLHVNINRYEAILEQHSRETEGLSAVLAGASRLARLSITAGSPKETVLRDVAAGVIAPVLTGYLLWVLRRAGQMGIKRLYFLSRDGQVLLEIARQLAQKYQLTVDLRYLYASRQSWNLPAIFSAAEDELAWIWDHPDRLCVKSLLARVGLTPEQVRAPLQMAGLKDSDGSRPLSPLDLQALQKTLLTPQVRALILEQARHKRALLLDYLQQEGVFEEPTWGLVDLGWYGSLQNSISAILQQANQSLPVGFYFALYQGAVPHRYSAYRESFFFNMHHRQGYIDAVPDLIALMEMFTVSDHGTVTNFARQNGRVTPVLKQVHNQKVLDWGLPLVRQTICSFLDQLFIDEQYLNPWADTRALIQDLLRAFWLEPSAAEAEAWGAFPWEDGLGAETYYRPLAEPYGWKDLLRALVRARVAPHHRAAWMNGSLALTRWPVRFALRHLARAFSLYRSLRWRANARLGSWIKHRR